MMKKEFWRCLCVLLLISLIPAQVLADSGFVIIPFEDETPDFDSSGGYSAASGEELLTSLMEMLNPSNPPASFADETITPYNTQKNEAFTILEKAEVFRYSSISDAVKRAEFLDNLEYKYDSGIQTSKIFADTADAASLNGSALGGLQYAQGTAFDPTGCGRRNYVAIMGFQLSNVSPGVGYAKLYILNADTKRVVQEMTLRSDGKLYDTIVKNKWLHVIDSRNFFQITAGDYNGDGRDSLVLYAGGIRDYDNSSLFEIICTGDASTPTFTSKQIVVNDMRSKGQYFHNGYIYGNDPFNVAVPQAQRIVNSYHPRNQLGVSLATGDVNGDGIDDLAVLSYAMDMASQYLANYSSAVEPWLALGFGKAGTGSIQDLTVGNGHNLYNMAAPGVAMGDINGDGKDEVVVAGFRNQFSSSDVYNIKDGEISYQIYRVTQSGFGITPIKAVQYLTGDNVSPLCKGTRLKENESVIQQFGVECIAVNGKNSKAIVYLNGYCYDFNGTDLVYGQYRSVPYPSDLNGKIVQEIFVYSTSKGNIFDSEKGEEVLLITYGFKTLDNVFAQEAESSYFFATYFIKPGTGSFEGDSQFKPFMPAEFTSAAAGTNGPCSLAIACDYGNDSVIGRYAGKAFTYTDPTPVAFLQAAPYFGEFDPGNSSTTYSFTEGYELTNGSSTEISYNVGVAAELQAGPVKTSLEAGVANELTTEFTDSIEKTFTTTFEANGENQVVVRQTLLYYYYYDVANVAADGTTTYTPNALVIAVPQYPVMASFSVDQYNALATAYNTKVAASTDKHINTSHVLPVISDALREEYYLNNEGNPYAYAADSSQYTGGWDMSKVQDNSSDNWMMLSHAGGTQSQAFTVTATKEQTTSVAEGGYTNLSIMAGTDLKFVSAYGGATASYERLDGNIYSTAAMTSTETAGTVQNLDGNLTCYNFTWKLIGWKSSRLLGGVPCVGYAVRSQNAPPQAVTDLTATYSAENGGCVILTWTSPEIMAGRDAIDWFYINSDQETGFIDCVTNAGEGTEYSVTISVKDYSPRYATFTVSAYNEASNESGAPSNEAYCLFAVSDQEINSLIAQAKEDLQKKLEALEKALEEETDDLDKAIADLIEAYQAADKLLKTELTEAQALLKTELTAADEGLQKAIDKVNKDLTEAVQGLRQATEDNLQTAITDLTEAYLSADALLQANIDSLTEALAALEQAMLEADTSLQEAIAQVKADLDEVKKELEAAQAADVDRLTRRMNALNSALDAAYKLADELLRKDIDGLSQRLDAQETKHQQDVDALLAQIEALKAQIAEQDGVNALAFTTLQQENSTQQQGLDTSRTIAIVGLCIGSVSFAGMATLLLLLLKKKALLK